MAVSSTELCRDLSYHLLHMSTRSENSGRIQNTTTLITAPTVVSAFKMYNMLQIIVEDNVQNIIAHDSGNAAAFSLVEDGTPVTVSIAQGHYTSTTIISSVQTAMNAASAGNTYTVTYADSTGKITMTRATGTKTFTMTVGTKSWDLITVLGFSSTHAAATSQVADNVLVLALPLEILVYSFATSSATGVYEFGRTFTGGITPQNTASSTKHLVARLPLTQTAHGTYVWVNTRGQFDRVNDSLQDLTAILVGITGTDENFSIPAHFSCVFGVKTQSRPS